jgi:hypothetical protein
MSQTGVSSLSSIFGHKKAANSTVSPPPGQSLSGSNSSSTSNLLLQNGSNLQTGGTNDASNLLASPIQQQPHNSPLHGNTNSPVSLPASQNLNSNAIESSASSSSLMSTSNNSLGVANKANDTAGENLTANDIETDKLLNAIEKSKGFSDSFSTTATRRLRNKDLQFPAFNTKNDRFQVKKKNHKL